MSFCRKTLNIAEIIFWLVINNLSRMRGNSHVRFLGESEEVTPLTYPTKYYRRFNCMITTINEFFSNLDVSFIKIDYIGVFIAILSLFVSIMSLRKTEKTLKLTQESLVLSKEALESTNNVLDINKNMYELSSKDYVPKLEIYMDDNSVRITNHSNDLFEIEYVDLIGVEVLGFEYYNKPKYV